MEFIPNQPVVVKETGVVEVTFGEVAPPLAPGFHTFQLVVVDDLGVSSDPVMARVFVAARPTASLIAPEKVGFGEPFKLDGSQSESPDGRITQWVFTLLKDIEGPLPQ